MKRCHSTGRICDDTKKTKVLPLSDSLLPYFSFENFFTEFDYMGHGEMSGLLMHHERNPPMNKETSFAGTGLCKKAWRRRSSIRSEYNFYIGLSTNLEALRLLGEMYSATSSPENSIIVQE
jgi:hypothetical protein